MLDSRYSAEFFIIKVVGSSPRHGHFAAFVCNALYPGIQIASLYPEVNGELIDSKIIIAPWIFTMRLVLLVEPIYTVLLF